MSQPSLGGGGLLVQSQDSFCGIFLDRSGGARQDFPLARMVPLPFQPWQLAS